MSIPVSNGTRHETSETETEHDHGFSQDDHIVPVTNQIPLKSCKRASESAFSVLMHVDNSVQLHQRISRDLLLGARKHQKQSGLLQGRCPPTQVCCWFTLFDSAQQLIKVCLPNNLFLL